MGVSELVIGLMIAAIGTSLPELATPVVAAYRGEADILVGNVLMINPMFPAAWEGLAESCRRIHDQARAEQCLRKAKQVRDSLAWQQVVAGIRRNHPFWR